MELKNPILRIHPSILDIFSPQISARLVIRESTSRAKFDAGTGAVSDRTSSVESSAVSSSVQSTGLLAMFLGAFYYGARESTERATMFMYLQEQGKPLMTQPRQLYDALEIHCRTRRLQSGRYRNTRVEESGLMVGANQKDC